MSNSQVFILSSRSSQMRHTTPKTTGWQRLGLSALLFSCFLFSCPFNLHSHCTAKAEVFKSHSLLKGQFSLITRRALALHLPQWQGRLLKVLTVVTTGTMTMVLCAHRLPKGRVSGPVPESNVVFEKRNPFFSGLYQLRAVKDVSVSRKAIWAVFLP